jgi:hypothetical protein
MPQYAIASISPGDIKPTAGQFFDHVIEIVCVLIYH